MAVDIPALRAWADAVVTQLPPESESYGRAQTALFLIEWATDARLCLQQPNLDDVGDLLRRWRQAVE